MKRVTRAFVDQVEDGRATLIVDGKTVTLPEALLPDGAGEGHFVEISVAEIATPPEEAAAAERRRKLDGDGEP